MNNTSRGLSPWLLSVAVAALLTACGEKQDDVTATAAQDGAPTVASDKIFDMPYLMRDLDNGLRVIVVPTDYPDIVSIQIPVQTGSRNEVEPGKSGFAHFFEHMMFRGTEAYPAHVYADILKKAGADRNAYTTNDYTNYHITFTKADRTRGRSFSTPEIHRGAVPHGSAGRQGRVPEELLEPAPETVRAGRRADVLRAYLQAHANGIYR